MLWLADSNNLGCISNFLPLKYFEFDITLKVAYWISSNSSFIQYCDSNIRLFSIAPPLVVVLNPFASTFV